MGSKKVDRVPLVFLLLIVLSVCAAGGRELAEGKIQKDHYNAASKEGTTVPGNHPRNLMNKAELVGAIADSNPAPAP